jgi:hypothetical protein
VAHGDETPPKAAPPAKVVSDLVSTKTLVLVSLSIALPWLGFQIFEDDPASRPALLDNALMGILGVWLTRFGVGASKGGD